MATKATTLEKLDRLQTFCRRGHASDIVELTLDKIIAYEIATAEKQAAEFQERLNLFEVQYQMSSEDFYRRFRKGEMGDEIDFVEWSAFYDMWVSVQERLKILESESK